MENLSEQWRAWHGSLPGSKGPTSGAGEELALELEAPYTETAIYLHSYSYSHVREKQSGQNLVQLIHDASLKEIIPSTHLFLYPSVVKGTLRRMNTRYRHDQICSMLLKATLGGWGRWTTTWEGGCLHTGVLTSSRTTLKKGLWDLWRQSGRLSPQSFART